MCYLLFDLVSRGSISPLFFFFFFSSPILQVMIISDLVTEFLGSEPGFDPEFSDCYLITLHQTLSVKYTQCGCLGCKGWRKQGLRSFCNE